MRNSIRRAALHLLKSAGVFRLVGDSRWRRARLLILCYHGIALEDEHQWRPALYLEPARLEQRLELLRNGRYNVLPLGEGLRQLYAGALPPRSVAITFDDGTYDFYKLAYPLLKRSGFPFTVYQTTYYSENPRPVFNLICSYMLWKRRGALLDKGQALGLSPIMDLRTEARRQAIVRSLEEISERENLTGSQKNELASRLAALLEIDYEALVAKRILQVMSPQEVALLAQQGVDFQLHTHRHRMPKDEALFRREIRDNRESLRRSGLHQFVHFCYPSGAHDPKFLPWLVSEGVVSATTCDPGLASSKSNALLLPRLVDTTRRSLLEFESWLTGVGDLLVMHRTAIPRNLPLSD